jgi:hypothetical protein
VNWRCVAHPIALGGLGVHDLERTGLALHLRWVWLSCTDERRAWAASTCNSPRRNALSLHHHARGQCPPAKLLEDCSIDGCSHQRDCSAFPRLHPQTASEIENCHRWAQDILGTLGIHENGRYLWQAIEGTTSLKNLSAFSGSGPPVALTWTAVHTLPPSTAHHSAQPGSKSGRYGRHLASSSSTGWPTRTAAGWLIVSRVAAYSITCDVSSATRSQRPCITCYWGAPSPSRSGILALDDLQNSEQ